jgi:hypothetical protein
MQVQLSAAFTRAIDDDHARARMLERELERFRPEVRAPVRALAACHPRLADLAHSFPALLFALAVPRRGFEPEPVIAHAIAGARLAQLAAMAGIPWWLRKLTPQMLRRPVPRLPDSPLFRREIATHLPGSARNAPAWIESVSVAAETANEAIAIWYARNIARDARPEKHLRLLCLWAWFSQLPGTLGHGMIDVHWSPSMKLANAARAAEEWLSAVRLHVNLGDCVVDDMWLRPGNVDGYEFVPLCSVADITEEARAMRNCLRAYGWSVVHNYARLWSVRKEGLRVATLRIACHRREPLLNIVELKAPRNREASTDIWWAARRWLHMHDLPNIDTKRRHSNAAPLDRNAWISIWRPFWLAKQRIPDWLPLAPSRDALDAL